MTQSVILDSLRSKLCFHLSKHCPERFLGIISQNPSVSKANRLHVDIFQSVFTSLRYVP